jgi:hypothetical protein
MKFLLLIFISSVALGQQKQSEKIAVKAFGEPWYVDVNIGGQNAFVSLGTTGDQTTIGRLSHSNLDMVVNANSAPAGIPCSDGSATIGGLTCTSGSEMVGALFSAPATGRYEACLHANYYTEVNTGEQAWPSFTLQNVQTSDATTTIQAGRSKNVNGFQLSGSLTTTIEINFPLNLCDTFNLAAGNNLIILKYQVDIIGTVDSFLLLDRSNIINRDAHFTVKRIIGG